MKQRRAVMKDLDPETRADLDQLWHTIQTYVNHSCDGADGCHHCHTADVDAVRASVAYQRIQAKLKAAEQLAPAEMLAGLPGPSPWDNTCEAQIAPHEVCGHPLPCPAHQKTPNPVATCPHYEYHLGLLPGQRCDCGFAVLARGAPARAFEGYTDQPCRHCGRHITEHLSQPDAMCPTTGQLTK